MKLRIELNGVKERLDPRATQAMKSLAYTGGVWSSEQASNCAAILLLESQHDEDLAEAAELFLKREIGFSLNRRELQDRVEKYSKALEEERSKYARLLEKVRNELCSPSRESLKTRLSRLV